MANKDEGEIIYTACQYSLYVAHVVLCSSNPVYLFNGTPCIDYIFRESDCYFLTLVITLLQYLHFQETAYQYLHKTGYALLRV